MILFTYFTNKFYVIYLVIMNTDHIPSCLECNNKTSLFCSLDNEEKQVLSQNKGQNFYKKGHVIFYEGNYANGLYCIYNGKVKLSKLGSDGKQQIFRLSNNGDVLGYRALLSNEPYQATATAIEDCYICHISKDRFQSILKENSRLSWKTIQMLSKDLKNAEKNLMNIVQKNVKERVAEALLMLVNTFGTNDKDYSLNVSLNRLELSDLVGTTSETIIRTLSELKKSGCIDLKGKKIIVINPSLLSQIARLTD